ncbi:membrane-associated 5'-nucleotidase/phosphoesterase [Clostridioides difficile]|uniref:bifunctional metallophosphatase/5'-nucleotidase n=1 Tax=Clostridioides difficile TaxID=1496 RepID=UPI000D1D907C|nr:bifunctional metallophosphatase/5'-nucleotidase [Clostridioides difficile]UWD41976.1 bifunctional metallophosphatase/5'-nucleotidase [Clostridioides difficile]UWD45613.1 bifunctional metallophosphatase/5'-nucleotidase [Clostridioides difficile]VFF91993.1 membrane-associated 5'-nucleotidase/phosphoesterase [Clostridioides difficile]VIF64321.1 membrane-associated 5'-nucleotidase/phosphoesterase [Clostridioides difficile]HBE9435247.1 bifunctional metallophosphatase/5'-nucleotidase [Clostridioi
MKIRRYLILVIIILITTSQSFISYGLDRFEEITIFHTNDIHGRYAEGDEHIQIGNLATLKKETPNSILVDAGDCLHGLPIVNMGKGKNAVELIKCAGYDYITPGNHDFNYGKDRLFELSTSANLGENTLKFLSSNIFENGRKVFDSNDIKEINGVKIGFFGLSTQETKNKTGFKNVEGLEFKNPIESATEQVSELKEKGADVIVAICHIGTNTLSKPNSIDIANKVQGIDLIIDGHSHTKFENGKQVGDTLIVSTGQYLENIGEVKLTLDTDDVGNIKIENKSARLIGKEEALKYKLDSSVSKKVDEIKEQQEKILDKVIGVTTNTLDGSYENVRTKETNLGNLISDILLDKTKADISLFNGGNIRDTIEKGNITIRDIVDVFPFSNTIVTKELTGAQIKDVLEHGVKIYPEKSSAFLQVGGISYYFNPKQKEGERITSIQKEGKPLDLDKKYVVATNDYIASGGDEFPCFSKEPILKEFGNLESAVTEYIEYKREISKNVDGRIGIKSKDELISENQESDLILSENKESINDNEENLSNNIKSSDSDKNKILDKTRTRESSNLGISKREAREKSPKTGDLGFSNSIIIFIVSSTLICLLNFNQKELKNKKSK